MATVLCTAVGTAGHQHGLEACTVYGDRTVCSCRHSRSSAWVRKIVVSGVPGVHQNVTCSTKPVCTKLGGKTRSMFPFDALLYVQKTCKVK